MDTRFRFLELLNTVADMGYCNLTAEDYELLTDAELEVLMRLTTDTMVEDIPIQDYVQIFPATKGIPAQVHYFLAEYEDDPDPDTEEALPIQVMVIEFTFDELDKSPLDDSKLAQGLSAIRAWGDMMGLIVVTRDEYEKCVGAIEADPDGHVVESCDDQQKLH